MIESIPAPAAVQAALLMMIVLAEAAVLYAGYGYAEQAIASRALERIRNA